MRGKRAWGERVLQPENLFDQAGRGLHHVVLVAVLVGAYPDVAVRRRRQVVGVVVANVISLGQVRVRQALAARPLFMLPLAQMQAVVVPTLFFPVLGRRRVAMMMVVLVL